MERLLEQLGISDEETTRLLVSLGPVPGEVLYMFRHLEKELLVRLDDQVASVTMLNLREDFENSVDATREDILRLLIRHLSAAHQNVRSCELNQAENPGLWTLKTAAIPEVVAIGKVHYSTYRAGSQEARRATNLKSIHSALSAVSATQSIPGHYDRVKSERGGSSKFGCLSKLSCLVIFKRTFSC